MRWGSASCLLVAGLLCAWATFSPARAGAGPSLTSVEDNVSYAVASICAPYALDDLDRTSLPIGRGLVQPDGHDGLARPNPTGVRVGMAGFVHVTFSQKSGSRSCDVQAKGADPQALRKAALDVLATRPERFAPTKSRYLPGSFATEDGLCSSPDSTHPGAFVMLSSPTAAERDRIAILFTLTNQEPRGAQCDHDGVRLNYRTLVSPPWPVSLTSQIRLGRR